VQTNGEALPRIPHCCCRTAPRPPLARPPLARPVARRTHAAATHAAATHAAATHAASATHATATHAAPVLLSCASRHHQSRMVQYDAIARRVRCVVISCCVPCDLVGSQYISSDSVIELYCRLETVLCRVKDGAVLSNCQFTNGKADHYQR